ncbi:MAG: S9 family peptidase, partial [Gemmatimonadetes bacterium]|nr:S9 family peptidase [Gemmatimonadota bacterium]
LLPLGVGGKRRDGALQVGDAQHQASERSRFSRALGRDQAQARGAGISADDHAVAADVERAHPDVIAEKRLHRADVCDRQGYVDDGYTHVFVVPVEGGTPRQLTDGSYDHRDVAWSADGSEILFSSHREDGWEWAFRESDIYAVRVSDGRIRQLTTRRGPDGDPLPSPDGRLIAYTGADFHDETYQNDHVYVMEPDGSNRRMISGDFDRSYSLMEWAEDGSGVFLNVRREGTANVWFLPVDGGAARPVTEGNHMLSMASFAEGRAVGVREAYHEPGDVVSFDLASGLRSPLGEGALNELTHVNDDVLAGVTLGEVEEIWYESVDDFRIQGWIIKPPHFDPSREYPLILAIHGGPHGMYNVGFNFGWQDHAANGYVVLYTNPRGSSGYGSPFGNSIKYAYPGKDFDDLMKGVDEVIERGYVDSDNLFVYGCSGGGVLTSWIVGHTDRFAAASANCPVTNWLSFVGTTDGIGWYRDFEKFPWEDPSEHLRRSPLMYAGNVKTPTMLMTGELDLRTPMPQTEEFYAALRVQQVPAAMVRFKGEWHGTSSKPSNFLRSQLFLREWFSKWARPGTVTDDGR